MSNDFPSPPVSPSPHQEPGWVTHIRQHLSAVETSPDWADLDEILYWYKADVAELLAALPVGSPDRPQVEEWRTWGIVEIAVRNPNVSSYMNHWEGRALKAEAALAARPNRAAIADCCHIHHPTRGSDPTFKSVPFENCSWCQRIKKLFAVAPDFQLEEPPTAEEQSFGPCENCGHPWAVHCRPGHTDRDADNGDRWCYQGKCLCRNWIAPTSEAHSIKRKDTPENRRYWAFVERVAEQVRRERPSWAQLPTPDIVAAVGQPALRDRKKNDEEDEGRDRRVGESGPYAERALHGENDAERSARRSGTGGAALATGHAGTLAHTDGGRAGDRDSIGDDRGCDSRRQAVNANPAAVGQPALPDRKKTSRANAFVARTTLTLCDGQDLRVVRNGR